MRDQLTRALEGVPGYAEIRLRRRWSTTVVFRRQRLEVATEYHAFGGVVRCLSPGHGWGAVAFTDPDRAAAAVQRARELSHETGPIEPIQFASVPIRQVEPVEDLADDPRLVQLPAKRELLERLTQVLLGTDRRVTDSRTTYGDSVIETWLATNEGTWLHDLRSEATLGALAVAAENGTQERALESLALRGGWGVAADRDSLFEAAGRRAVERLHAAPIRPGRYPVVFDPRAGGALILQAIVNPCRAPARGLEREVLPLGHRVGPDILTIGDDPTAPGLRTSLALDDEGTPASQTTVVRNGVVVGHLHTRETAARFGVAPTGHGIAPALRSVPSARPTNAFLARGQGEFAELIADIDQGVYVRDLLGVAIEGRQITLTPAAAYALRGGAVEEPVRCPPITVDMLTLFGRLDRVAGDFAWDSSAASLAESGPMRPVTTGAPHTRFIDLEIGTLQS